MPSDHSQPDPSDEELLSKIVGTGLDAAVAPSTPSTFVSRSLSSTPAVQGAALQQASTPGVILQAVRSCDVAALRHHLATGVRVATLLDARDETGETPLHLAVRWGDVVAVKLLLDNCARVNTTSARGKTALDVAIEMHRVDCATLLLDRRAELGLVPNSEPTPLHYAAKCGWADVVRCLLDRGDSDGEPYRTCSRTPLEVAIQWDRPDVSALLLQRKAWAGVDGGGFQSALHYGVRHDASNVCLRILGLGVNANSTIGGRLPVHEAAEYGCYECLKLLIFSAAKLDAQDNDGKTALALASFSSTVAVVKLLLDSKAGANDSCRDGSTALHAAALHGVSETVHALFDAAASPNIAAHDGKTPLHIAAERGDLSITALLLAGRADVDSDGFDNIGGSGRTALHFAAQHELPEVADMLLQAQASPNIAEHVHGHTPLHVAVQYGSIECARVLLAHRANISLRAAGSSGWTVLELAIRCGNPEMERMILLEDSIGCSTQPTERSYPGVLSQERPADDICQTLVDHLYEAIKREVEAMPHWKGDVQQLVAKTYKTQVSEVGAGENMLVKCQTNTGRYVQLQISRPTPESCSSAQLVDVMSYEALPCTHQP